MNRFVYVSADRGIPLPGTKGSSNHVASVLREFRRRGMTGTLATARPEADTLEGFPVRPLEALRETAATADVVYERYSLWSLDGLEYARRHGLPFVLEVNSPLPEEAARFRTLDDPDLADHVARCAIGGADGVVCVSEAVARWAARYRACRDGLWVVPNGVDPERFSREVAARVPPPWGRSAGPVIAFCGSFRPWHGTDDLADAFAHVVRRAHADATLVCVGDGPERLAFEARLTAEGLLDRAVFSGAIPQREVPGWLAHADVAVAPYPVLDDFYYSPLKLFEFMALGLPVVAGRGGQIDDLLQDGAFGRTYEPGHAGALADAIGAVLRDRDAARRKAETARAWVLEHATWKARVDKIFRNLSASSAGVGAAG